ncbi:MAG: glucose-6-phosphate isomerase, partial [Oscillospiraceae bacterium]|nr:glucose-6-phosphate isomerase [Oscillospiraceae bacterium]
MRFSMQHEEGAFLDGAVRAQLREITLEAQRSLTEGDGLGAGMRGWMGFPAHYLASAEYKAVQAAAHQIRAQSEALLVIGIGGSYLGARAVIEALQSQYYNDIRRGAPAIYFAGNSLSEADIRALDAILEGKDFSINVISKSGVTLEPAVAFRHFLAKLKAFCGGDPEQLKRRLFVTTDAAHGALHTQAKAQGWTTFVIPDDMGGRFSVLSAVGLLPVACAGIDVGQLLSGAAAAAEAYAAPGDALEDNPCYHYAALRYHFYRHRKKAVELFVSYEPCMAMFGEWLKQLFGESEGKQWQGLFPASATFTTDLHSLGQYIQQGERILFETNLVFAEEEGRVLVEAQAEDGDELNYLAGERLHEINRTAFRATALAHAEGGVPGLVLELPRRDAFSIGWLIYFFEKACAVSGYMLGVNP